MEEQNFNELNTKVQEIQNNVQDLKENMHEEIKQASIEAAHEINKNIIKATENTYVVQLPSAGLINNNVTEVTLRRMTVKEVKTLSTSKDPNYLTLLLLNCIVEPTNISAKDLHPNDVLYLLFVLRYISSPKNVVQKVKCSLCGNIFESQVVVPELKVNYYTGSLDNEFETTLPVTGDTLTFRILSEGELIDSEKIANRQIRQQNLNDEDAEWHQIISRTALQLVAKNQLPFESFKDKVTYLESLLGYDFESYQQAYLDIINKFGLDPKYMSKCTHCGEDVEVMAYIAPDFFRLV